MRPVAIVQHEASEGPDLLRTWLTDDGIATQLVHAYAGERVELAHISGLIVLGGTMNANADATCPWLTWLRQTMADAVTDGVPTLGICLGAQLLATATGGRVERSIGGLEAGAPQLIRLPAADDDPLLNWLDDQPRAAQWHEDVITVLPPEATLLVTGDRYPHQGYRVGDRAWGVQFHPEVSAATFGSWVESGERTLTAAGLAPAVVRGEFDDNADAITRRWRSLSRAFAQIVAAR